jgi:hypothetical protein
MPGFQSAKPVAICNSQYQSAETMWITAMTKSVMDSGMWM